MNEASMRERWMSDVAPFGVEPVRADAIYDDIELRYGEPPRHYHTLDHVASVLTTIDELVPVVVPAEPRAVVFAGWLHDVVYDPRGHDNEAASARYAKEVLDGFGVPPALVRETARLIELTAGHAVDDDDRNGQVLADADLAILGAEAATYDRYATNVRAEYGHVPDDLFRRGRTAVLTGFLARPRLFRTDVMHERLDGAARDNLRRELAQWNETDPGDAPT